jgi:hypothetical protein
MPPYTWFGGVDFNFAVEMIDDLRSLGAEVFELDLYGFVARNELFIESAIASLKAFRPDLAITLPNAGYGLLSATMEGRNVFKDILGIPSLMLWDHGLLQFPKLVLDPLPGSPAEASEGSLKRLRTALNHALYIHYSPDRGHIAALDNLGIISASKVHFFLQPAYPNFVRYAYQTAPSNAFKTRIAFAGNVYLEASRNLPFSGITALMEVQSRVMAKKKGSLPKCLWDLFLEEIGELDKKTRRELRLEPESSFFWRYLHDEIELNGNTTVRLAVLTGLQHSYEFFGNFIEPASISKLRNHYNVTFRKSLDYFTELPLLFMNCDLLVDIVNLGYNSGISPKIIGCMACGGLPLFDYKDDFRDCMGDIAELVMYRSIEHLNALIETFLSDRRKRVDVTRYLQHRVSTEFSFRSLCRRMLVDEPFWRQARATV